MTSDDLSYSNSLIVNERILAGVSKFDTQWHRLENAATGFSLITSPRIPQVFRLSVTLKETINVTQLQKALDCIIIRFPFFRVNLKTGLFWHFWETNMSYPKVIADTKFPNQFIPITKKGAFPFQVKAFKKRIAVEFNHCITDGSGGLIFLKALMGEYLSLRGVEVSDWGDIRRPDQTPEVEEYEDSYRRYAKKVKLGRILQSRAFILPFKRIRKGRYYITKGTILTQQIIEKAKELKISITEFIVSALIESLQELVFSFPEKMRKRVIKPIRIMVPVNMRNIFPSKTMRNFALYVTPGIDPRLGKHEFEEIVKQIHHYMKKEVNAKYFVRLLDNNVSSENMIFLRLTPLVVKKFFGQRGYFFFGTTLYSSVLTNLGRVTIPKELEEYITEFEFVPGQSPVNKVGAAMISYKDKLIINFGRLIEDPIVERLFFRNLTKRGIQVKIQTN